MLEEKEKKSNNNANKKKIVIKKKKVDTPEVKAENKPSNKVDTRSFATQKEDSSHFSQNQFDKKKRNNNFSKNSENNNNQNFQRNNNNSGGGGNTGNRREFEPRKPYNNNNNTDKRPNFNKDNKDRDFGNKDRGDFRKPTNNKDSSPFSKRVVNLKKLNNNSSSMPVGFKKEAKAHTGGGVGGATSVDVKKQNTRWNSKEIDKKKHPKGYEKRKSKDEENEKFFEEMAKKKEKAALSSVPRTIDIMEGISVSELAKKMNLKGADLIAKLMGMGMMVTINETIDSETAAILASEYNCEVKVISIYDQTIIEVEKDEPDDLLIRPPIITVMGHVDHGKTRLLDAIRKSDIISKEHGGITQHIGAYTVTTEHGKVTFLDTPGHEAFTMMRLRGAQITDVVILVVAANDGVMPQTVEAIDHAKEAGVPIIVAINKIDLPEANPDKVKQQLSEYNLVPEDWGGQTQYVEISARQQIGISDLIDALILQAEILELKANPNKKASGRVIDAKIEVGRGIVTTIIVQDGTLRVGDSFVGGIHYGKVRAIFDNYGNKVKEASPSTSVEVIGFDGLPDAGDPFQVVSSEREAKAFSQKRHELKRYEAAKSVKKITLDNLYASIQDGTVQELKVIIKADVTGSAEALKSSLEKLSTREIRLKVIHAQAGAIIESDISLASASNAIIIGFHVRPTKTAQIMAEKEKVDIRKYNIIYDAVEDIRDAMEGLLSPEIKEVLVGKLEVRKVIKVPKIGLIAGSYVTEGKIIRNAQVYVIRDGIQVHEGRLSSLRRFKDDVKEVLYGFECGISIDNYIDVQEGDILEAFERIEVKKKLGKTIIEEEKAAEAIAKKEEANK